MTKDYYKILDITEFSTKDEIKRAYHRLARKYHPDVAGSSSEVLARFKEINEAYEILSDEVKKTSYDKARAFYNYGTQKTNTKTSYDKTSTNPNYRETYTSPKNDRKASFWEEIFKNQNVKENIKAPKKGEDIYSDIEISIFEAVNGTTKIINMLQSQVCPKCGGRKFVNGNKCQHCQGKGEISSYKRFSVKIPAGIKSGSKIRLAGEGEKGLYGGNNGDLYLNVHIQEPKEYKAEGLNILKTIPITPYEAVLGAEILVSTLIGNVILTIAPNTKNGQRIRLTGCGIKQKEQVGDMIVTVEIQIPQNISEEEISLYKKLKAISSKENNVRNTMDW